MTDLKNKDDTRGTPVSGRARHEPGTESEHRGVQRNVNGYFDSEAVYWDAVYRGEDLQGLIYRRRQAAVLDSVDAADLRPGAAVLEIGCGAGHLTIELAKRGLRVEAVDASRAMADATGERVRKAGLAEEVSVGVADVHAMPYESGRYDLVVAVGVIPWLHSPGGAVQEMARVLRPGGWLVLTADNRLRLTSFTDPRAILALTPLRRVYHALRKRDGVAMSRLDSPRGVNRLLREGGLRPVGRRTVGFGPVSLFGRSIFSDARGVRIDRRLQALADRGAPGLRWTGWHYVVCAVKPAGDTQSTSGRWELSDDDAQKLEAMRRRGPRRTEAVGLLVLHPSQALKMLGTALADGWRGAISSNAIASLVDGLRVQRAVPGAARSVDWAKADSFLEVLTPSLTSATEALELGCGDGRISRSVAPHVAHLVCTDVSKTMVDEAAKNLVGNENVSCEKVNGFALAAFADESFDVVFAQGVLTYMDPAPLLALLDEVHRVLRSSGICVFNFSTIDDMTSAQYLLRVARTGARKRRFSAAVERPYAESQIHAMYRAVGLDVLPCPSHKPGERTIVVGCRPSTHQ